MVNFQEVATNLRKKANHGLYTQDPVLWALDELGISFWSKQQELLMALTTHKNVAVKTTFSVGKTLSAAVAAGWWVATRGPDSLVFTTAPTNFQVRALLWSEIQRLHVRAGLPGRITQDARWMYPYGSTERMVASGVKPADGSAEDQEINTLQGLHRSGGILAIGDEANGLTPGIFRGLQRITTAEHDRILLLGNPTSPGTEFHRLFKERPEDWYLMTISAFDTPRFTGEEVAEELRRGMPNPEWVELRRKEWGEDSNRWKSNILAEFPTTADDGLFNQSLVEAAAKNQEHKKSDTAAPVIGVDVSRYGGDSTTVFVRWGKYVELLDSWMGLDTHETAERVAGHAKSLGCRELRVDAIGIGAGVVDNLSRMLPEADIYEMIGSAASPDPTKWYNARAYWYDKLREQIHAGDLTIPDHKTLLDEFSVIRYTIRGSAMLIESKEDMRKRGIKSPDYLDGLLYTCADVHGDGIEGEKLLTEEDVFDEYDLVGVDGLEPWMISPW